MPRSSTQQPLSTTERRVLEYIRGHVEAHGFPPTRREIVRAMGWKSSSVGQHYVGQLVKKGWLVVYENKTRAMRIIEEQSA